MIVQVMTLCVTLLTFCFVCLYSCRDEIAVCVCRGDTAVCACRGDTAVHACRGDTTVCACSCTCRAFSSS